MAAALFDMKGAGEIFDCVRRQIKAALFASGVVLSIQWESRDTKRLQSADLYS